MNKEADKSPRADKKLLIVDDVMINRIVLDNLFSDKLEVLEATNGAEALELIYQYGDEIAVVLLDLMMPVMDGFEVMEIMKEKGLIDSIPVIMITGENDDQKLLRGYELGVSDLISKPFNSEIVEKRVTNVIDLYAHRHQLEAKLQEQKGILERQAERIRQFDQFIIDALSTTVEFRDQESGQHIKRIRSLTKMFLNYLKKDYNLTDDQIDIISTVSAMHDIGKIAIPDAILQKPGRLTPEEYEIMKAHTLRGCEILETLSDVQDQEYYNYSYEICRHHHERWDGKGYPDGLKGDEISIWAQAASLADVYDALTSDRVYRKALSVDESIGMIVRGECGQFNPQLIKCLLDMQEDLKNHTHALWG